MDIVEFYRQLLQSLGCSISPEGLVSTTINGSAEPMIVTKANNKRLTLPTPFYLDNPNEEALVQFHPMSEGYDKGESEVLTSLKRLIASHLMFRICDVMALVAKIAADHELQKNLKPSATREFSKYLKDFDKKSYKLVMDILGKINPSDRDHKGRALSTICITLLRRQEIFGKPYQRVAVVSFPLMEAILVAKEEMIETGTSKIFGITPGRKNQYDILANLFNFIFPDAETIGSWSMGSNSLAAPYFHALLTTYVKIAERLNEVVNMVSKNASKEYPELLYNLTWKDQLNDDFSQFVGRLPPAQHNKGKMAGKSEEDQDDMKTAITRMAPEQPGSAPVQYQVQSRQPEPVIIPQVQQPQVQHQQQVVQQEQSNSGGVDPMALLNKLNAPVMHNQQGPAMQMVQLANGQYMQVPVQQQVQPQVVQVQQPQVQMQTVQLPTGQIVQVPIQTNQQVMPMQQPAMQYINAPQVQMQPQDPMVSAYRIALDNFGNPVQQQIQLTLSMFNQMMSSGQLPAQQPVFLNGGVQQGQMHQGNYSYQDGVAPVQQVMMNNGGGMFRAGGRRTVAESEMQPTYR